MIQENYQQQLRDAVATKALNPEKSSDDDDDDDGVYIFFYTLSFFSHGILWCRCCKGTQLWKVLYIFVFASFFPPHLIDAVAAKALDSEQSSYMPFFIYIGSVLEHFM